MEKGYEVMKQLVESGDFEALSSKEDLEKVLLEHGCSKEEIEEVLSGFGGFPLDDEDLAAITGGFSSSTSYHFDIAHPFHV